MPKKQATQSSSSTAAIVLSSALAGGGIASIFAPQYLLHAALGGTAFGTLTATTMSDRHRKVTGGREVVSYQRLSPSQLFLPHSLQIADIDINESKSLNILVAGRTGSGKTQAIKGFINSVRNRSDIRLVILDRGGELLQSFYDSSKDLMSNPTDRRSVDWLHRKEFLSPHSIAKALIPMPEKGNDPIWYEAARILIVEIWRTTHSNREVLQVLRSPLTEIRDRIAGTQAAQFFEDPKLATSVLFTLNTFCRFYESLIDGTNQFSFFEYGASDRPEWLFFPLLSGNEETFKPLYSMAFDLIIQGILSRGDNNNMKTIIIIDELGALQKIPSLERLLSEGRKSGGSALIGTQSLAQITKTYGQDGTNIFLQNTFTKFIFSCPDPDDSERMAKVIGKQDIWEESYSANYSMMGRESVNRSWQPKEKDVVSPSEIQSLADLEGYCVIADSMKVHKFRIQPRDYGKLNAVFIQNPQTQIDPWQVDIGL